MALGPSNRFKRVGTYSEDQLLKDLRDFEEEVANIALTPGEQGEKGDKGDPGIQGTPGIPGEKGAKGDTGSQGLKGNQGEQGEPGVDGEDGDNAVDRDDFGLIDVDLGLITEDEIDEVDDYGGVLADGLPQGAGDLTLYVQGDRGPRGLQGEQGPEGPEGPEGPQGIPGTDGIDGVDGADGAPGATGPAGPGLPVGGTAGQIPRKVDGTDYNTAWHTPVKADVGLGNVDNTSDVNKPVSTAQQTALDLKISIAAIETHLPDRLKAHDSSAIADANTVHEFGISWTDSATANIPEAAFGMLFTIPGNSSGGENVSAQFWYRYNNSNAYRRRRAVSTWTAWESVLETKDQLNLNYGSLSDANTWADTNTFNGLIDLVGGNLRFPATQIPSANANTLDDYEEGTYTPTLSFVTPGDLVIAYSTQIGKYVKIGKAVLINFEVVTSTFTHSTASGNCLIGGLPFTSPGPFFGSLIWGGLTLAAGYTQVAPLSGLDTSLRLNAMGSGVSPVGINPTTMVSGGTKSIRGALVYFID